MAARVFSSSISHLLFDGPHQLLDIVPHAPCSTTQAHPFRRQQLLDDSAMNTAERTPGDTADGANVSLQLLRRIV
jgi:hypothetical protein